jgi:hypothetical protein
MTVWFQDSTQTCAPQETDSKSRTSDGASRVRCRQIGVGDFGAIADLLAAGFPRRSRQYWARALDMLSERPPVEGFPQFGYMLESGATAVGAILLLFATMPGSSAVRCNGSSWYVAPAFRSFAALLIMRTLRHRAAHTNLTPSSNAVPILEAMGYRKFCNGVFAAAPALNASDEKIRIVRVREGGRPEQGPPSDVERFLQDHARFGCLSFWCETGRGGSALIFRRRFVKLLPLVPVAQLIYCAGIDDLASLAGPIGRHLALNHGMPFMIVPANGPVPGLVGRYFDNKPMYCRGNEPPRLGDLAYTEFAMFGV